MFLGLKILLLILKTKFLRRERRSNQIFKLFGKREMNQNF